MSHICGPDCRYRSLYEGTQTSLTDMASKQATALGRVGRLRSGIAASLKRNFGRQFTEAERALGGRISDLEDELLLAYLGSFLQMAEIQSEPQGLDSLRFALESLNLELPKGNNLETWARSIVEQKKNRHELEALFSEEPHAKERPKDRSEITIRATEPKPGPDPSRRRRLIPPKDASSPPTQSDKDHSEEMVEIAPTFRAKVVEKEVELPPVIVEKGGTEKDAFEKEGVATDKTTHQEAGKQELGKKVFRRKGKLAGEQPTLHAAHNNNHSANDLMYLFDDASESEIPENIATFDPNDEIPLPQEPAEPYDQEDPWQEGKHEDPYAFLQESSNNIAEKNIAEKNIAEKEKAKSARGQNKRPAAERGRKADVSTADVSTVDTDNKSTDDSGENFARTSADAYGVKRKLQAPFKDSELADLFEDTEDSRNEALLGAPGSATSENNAFKSGALQDNRPKEALKEEEPTQASNTKVQELGNDSTSTRTPEPLIAPQRTRRKASTQTLQLPGTETPQAANQKVQAEVKKAFEAQSESLTRSTSTKEEAATSQLEVNIPKRDDIKDLADIFEDDQKDPAEHTLVNTPALSTPLENAAPLVQVTTSRKIESTGPVQKHTSAQAAQETKTAQETLQQKLTPVPVSTRLTPGLQANMGMSLRPEVFLPAPAPKTRSKKGPARVVRTAALPPETQVFDVPPENLTTGELTDDIRSALVAAVCIPRPVFAHDLIAIAGSMDLVSQWETENRAQDDSPVRFIPAKARHRQRGSLILPYDQHRTAATEFSRSIWSECMKRYRGAKLYELAVLVHRLNDEIVGHRLGDNTVLLRLNQSRGLVGVSVVIDTKLGEDEPTRNALIADVAELLSERLTLVAVLTTNAEILEPMIQALSDEAAKNKWNPSMPVIAGKSWEYAEDKGSSSVLVIGG